MSVNTNYNHQHLHYFVLSWQQQKIQQVQKFQMISTYDVSKEKLHHFIIEVVRKYTQTRPQKEKKKLVPNQYVQPQQYNPTRVTAVTFDSSAFEEVCEQ